MILSPEDRTRAYVRAGIWNRVTVDQVFRKGLTMGAERPCLLDAGPTSVPGTGAAMTFAEADRRVEGLAAFFAGIGMRPDMVLGVHLPASADAAVIVLAALRAGLIVCPLPLAWSRAEIEAAIAAASIKAIVTASAVEDDPIGEMVRDVAGETFAIRFVFAVGAGLPDGLIDLSAVLADLDALGPAPEIVRRGAPADHVALLSFARSAEDKLVVVPYAHNHLVAIALGHLLEGGLEGGARLLSTMHPASLAGLAGGLVTALLAGGSVAFHHPTTLDGLAEAIEEADAARAVLPAAFGAAAAALGGDRLGLSLVSTGLERTEAVAGAGRTVDLLTVAGHCLVPVKRTADGRSRGLPAGAARLPGAASDAPALVECRVKPRMRPGDRKPPGGEGELLLSGGMIPDAPWPEPASGGSGASLAFSSDGQMRPPVIATAAPGAERLTLAAPAFDAVVSCGRTISPTRLDQLYRRHPKVQDAAVFGMEADAVGERIGLALVPKPGERPTLADVLGWLDGEAVGALDRPTSIVIVPEIPRGADGAVLRRSLFTQAVA